MREITVPWGAEKLSLKVPASWELIYPESSNRTSKRKISELKIVADALQKPAGSPPIEKLKLRGKKIVIVTDDNTRPTPVSRYLHLVFGALKKGGASMKNVLIIPALGIHTPMFEDEMAVKAGAKNLDEVMWENHNAFDKDKNSYFGTTKRGTPVYLNKHLSDAGLVVLLGMTEPHLWAGFGGGMKNILPGLASAETIGIHHTIITEPPYHFNRVGMAPEKNSFRLDLEEVQGMIPAPIFSLNVVLDHDGKIKGAFAGDPVASHREAVKFNISESGLKLDRQVDAVIVNSNPMDINFKQGMKCVGNSLPALKSRGVVMAFMRAERGIDDLIVPEKGKPLWLVRGILRAIGPSRVLKFLEKVRKGLNVEEKFLLYYSMQLMREHDLFFYVPTLTEDEIKRLGFFKHSYKPQDIIDMASKQLGKDARVAVFPNGGATFPVLE